MVKKSIYDQKKKSKPARVWGSPKERDFILENTALLISAGIGISESVSIVAESLKSRQLKKVLARVIESLEEGIPFWKSLDMVGLFNDNYINLIKVSEGSGRLIDNLKLIVSQQQKDRTFKAKVRAAMIYPGIVFSLIIVIGLGIAWFVLPKLLSAFTGMKLKVPLITQLLMNFGSFLQDYGYIFVPTFLIGLFLLFYFMFIFKKTRFIGQAILIHVPVAKDIMKQTEIARFGFVLSGLLKSGLPVIEAIDSLIKTSTYRPYTKFYKHLYSKIEEGYSFKNSFISYKSSKKLIPLPIQQMIIAGEKSGNLPDVLEKIALIYEEKVDVSAENLAILLEPLLLIIIFAAVLTIALAVIIPIYSLIGNMGV
ncbi:MAG: type II secretion system F family protein [Thiobacillus sp.]